MKKGDIVKLINCVDDEYGSTERFQLLEAPNQEHVLVEVICDLSEKPTRRLNIADLELDKRKMAFREASQAAYGSPCDSCGKVEQFPGKGLGLYEEPYCGPKWLCEDCFPDEFDEDED